MVIAWWLTQQGQCTQIALNDCTKFKGTITHFCTWLSVWPLLHNSNSEVKRRPDSQVVFMAWMHLAAPLCQIYLLPGSSRSSCKFRDLVSKLQRIMTKPHGMKLWDFVEFVAKITAYSEALPSPPSLAQSSGKKKKKKQSFQLFDITFGVFGKNNRK